VAGKDDGKDLNLIGHGTTIEGKVRSQGSVRVDGRIVGEISAYEGVSIGGSGEVDGNVTAKNITVGGKVRGNLNAQEKLVFLSQAVVQGDIRASRLVVDEGAMFDGKCSMAPAAKPADGGAVRIEPKSVPLNPPSKH
jgi:cytoskeletal protein CcmA (bactofilin family)